MKKLRLLIFAAAALFSGNGLLQAAPTTFAQFFELFGTNDFVFHNMEEGATFNTIPGGSQVGFLFYSANVPGSEVTGVLPAGVQLATLTRTSTINTPANCDAPCLAGSQVNQPIANTTITITRNSDNANLLTILALNSVLTGGIEGNASTSFGSDPPQTVTFTSDFIDFGSTASRAYSVGYTSVVPSLHVGGNGFLQNFTAAGAGTFSADFVVPEPTSFLLIGTGLLAVALVSRRFA